MKDIEKSQTFDCHQVKRFFFSLLLLRVASPETEPMSGPPHAKPLCPQEREKIMAPLGPHADLALVLQPKRGIQDSRN